MNRLDQLFQKKSHDLLNLYATAGYPHQDSLLEIAPALEAAGVDLMEVGMPYSDPLADGPTIQQSSQVAIKNGMHLALLFEQIRTIRETVNVPIILMGYLNQVLQFGKERFLDGCVDAGVDGLILPDLPLHEFEAEYKTALEERDLRISFLLTPETPEGRIRKIDALSSGFVYMVSRSSITGGQQAMTAVQTGYFERIEAMQLQQPRMIGFGISDHQSFALACRYAHGGIIGSAFLRAIAAVDDLPGAVEAFVEGIRSPPESGQKNSQGRKRI